MILIIVENLTAGFFVLWFGLAAFVAALVTKLGFSFEWQLTVFVCTSGLLLFFSRVIFNRIFKSRIWGSDVATNFNALLGKRGIVKTEVNNIQRTGEVNIDGNIYWAICKEEMNIAVGSNIEVIGIQGNRLIVKNH